MVNVEPINVPYFVYDNYHSADICLKGKDVPKMLEEIEGGENPFDIIPEFSKKLFNFRMERSFPFGRFETRSQIFYDNERVFEEKEVNPKQIGKLLVPHYNVVDRSGLWSKYYSLIDQEKYQKLMQDNCDNEFFYNDGRMGWHPLDSKKIFVLTEGQLA